MARSSYSQVRNFCYFGIGRRFPEHPRYSVRSCNYYVDEFSNSHLPHRQSEGTVLMFYGARQDVADLIAWN